MLSNRLSKRPTTTSRRSRPFTSCSETAACGSNIYEWFHPQSHVSESGGQHRVFYIELDSRTDASWRVEFSTLGRMSCLGSASARRVASAADPFRSGTRGTELSRTQWQSRPPVGKSFKLHRTGAEMVSICETAGDATLDEEEETGERERAKQNSAVAGLASSSDKRRCLVRVMSSLGTQSPYLLLTRSARAVLRQLQTLLLLFDPGQSRFKFLPLLRNGTTRIPPGKLHRCRRLPRGRLRRRHLIRWVAGQ